MAASVYADWLQRGRVHMAAGRPIDALLCFRRAAKENARGADSRFLQGEALWQLGLIDDAIRAWRDAAQVDATFLAARQALAEGLLAQGDYAGARSAAAEALTIAPADLRMQAAHAVASAALADAASFERCATELPVLPQLAALPAYAPALAVALANAPQGATRAQLVAKLLPLAATLPSVLLAEIIADAFADNPRALVDTLRTRAWQRNEIDVLRRIIVAVEAREPALAQALAATHAAMCMAEPLLVPSLWPLRTGGTAIRIAWLMPAPDSVLFAAACATVGDVLRHFDEAIAISTVLCAGDGGTNACRHAGYALGCLPAAAALSGCRARTRAGRS